MIRKTLKVFSVALCLSWVLLLHTCVSTHVASYDVCDALGLSGRFPVSYWIGLAILLSAVVMFALGEVSSLGGLFLVLTYVVYVYAAPNLLEGGIANFYDAVDHLGRTRYVATFGQANPSTDRYFDMQSGFFYLPAALILVTETNPFWLIKYFPALYFLTLGLFLYVLFRMILKSQRYAILAYLVFCSFYVYSKGHYAPQALALLFYPLIMYVLFYGQGRKSAVVLLFLFSATVIVHQGVTAFLVLNMLGIVVLAYVLKGCKEVRLKPFGISAFFLVLIWLSYLVFMTLFTFNMWVETMRSLAEFIFHGSVLEEGLTQIWRPTQVRQTVIYLRLASSALVYSFGLMGILLMIRRRENGAPILLTLFLTNQLLGLQGIHAGGVGYIPRVVTLSLFPLAATCSYILSFLDHMKSRYVHLILLSSLLVFSMLNPFLLYTGEAFESVSISDLKASEFVVKYSYSSCISPHIITRAFLPEIEESNSTLLSIEGVLRLDSGSRVLDVTLVDRIVWLRYYMNWLYINEGMGESIEELRESLLKPVLNKVYDTDGSSVFAKVEI